MQENMENKKYRIVTPENIGPNIFPQLKEIIWGYLPHDRYVALTFDHLPLKEIASHLFVNEKEAKKVKHKYMIVLTIRIITRNNYQPFGCIYWNGDEAKYVAGMLHIYIQALTNAGLRVVSTVCPADPYFINVIQHMTQISNLLAHNDPIIFSSGSVKHIVHIFDPPKLMKSVRDCFRQYDCFFKINNNEFIASWKDIEKWYKENSKYDSVREYEDKIYIRRENLIRTGYAVKIFSKTVSDGIYDLAYSLCSDDSGNMEGTAEFCLFFNNLFDTFNTLPDGKGPDLRKPVTKNSLHTVTWDCAENVFKYMCFLLPAVRKDEVLPEKRTKEVAVIQGDNPSNKKGKKDKKARKHKEATVQNNQQLEATNIQKRETNADNSIFASIKSSFKLCRLPCVHYWLLSVKGIKAVTEKLRECRFRNINTKYFNVDNVHCFFNVVRIINNTKVNGILHEPVYFELIDQELAISSLMPPATHAPYPDI